MDFGTTSHKVLKLAVQSYVRMTPSNKPVRLELLGKMIVTYSRC
jgi:hypothetical protein